ncbi:MAG: tetratricopeptide repeat protein [Bacteroidales bacterium]|nr:tetratricopeptide repeat protein [Bacteroidales bacterium]
MLYRFVILLVSLCFLLVSCENKTDAKDQAKQNNALNQQDPDPLAVLNSQITNDSTNADLLVERAKLYFKQDRIDRALRDINQALSYDSKQLEAYLLLSEIYYGMGQAENVRKTLLKAAEVAPNDPRPQVKLAELNLLQRKLDLALGYTDKALAMKSYNPDTYYVRGMIFLARKDTLSAIKNFMIARDQDENFFEALYQIGVVYSAQHNPLAVDFLKDAIKRFPDSFVARYQLALYLQDHNAVDEAIAHYDTLLMMQPDNSHIFHNLGYVHLVYLLDYEKAISYFDTALSIDPDYIDALYNKGRTLEEMGQYLTARDIYEQVLNKQTNYPLAVEGMNRLDRRK